MKCSDHRLKKQLVEKENLKLNTLIHKLKSQNNKVENELKGKILLLVGLKNQMISAMNIIDNDENVRRSPNYQELKRLYRSEQVLRVIDGIDFQLLKFDDSFHKKLSQQYPRLTANNLILCSLLKMNLSSKEIALILSTSTQSIKVARSRLRKKFNIQDEEITLVAFLKMVDHSESELL